MRTVRCDCCGTGAEAPGLDVLMVAGWTLSEDAPAKELVMLCPLCTWQRSRASEAVKAAVESAGGTPGAGEPKTRHAKGRGWWFWT